MNGVIVPCLIENLATRRDGTLKLTLGTNEVTPEKAAELFSLLNKFALVYICEKDSMNVEELAKVDQLDPEFTGKSQSQRLRNVLYVLWEKKPEDFKDFTAYYHFHTERIIDHLKSKIE